MRVKNLRVFIVGAVLLVLAAVFFLFMLSIASRSTNPAELMRTVGGVCGVVGGLAIAMMLAGQVGKKVARV